MKAITRDEFIGVHVPKTHRSLVWWAVQIYRPVVAALLHVDAQQIQVTAAAWDHAERVVEAKLVAWVGELTGRLQETIGMDVVADYLMRAYEVVSAAVLVDARELLKGASQ